MAENVITIVVTNETLAFLRSAVVAGDPSYMSVEGVAADIVDGAARSSSWLRDKIAMHALPACWRRAVKQGGPVNEIASRASFWAYETADAMLAERSK